VVKYYETNETSHLDGSLKAVKYHGQKRRDQTAKINDSDIVITTYHTLAADAASKQNPLGEISWFRIVLDEGKFKLNSAHAELIWPQGILT
jgi:SWI/SNF-related matrix-associated actin-dependent regulator of chromatin subfamily A3